MVVLEQKWTYVGEKHVRNKDQPQKEIHAHAKCSHVLRMQNRQSPK